MIGQYLEALFDGMYVSLVLWLNSLSSYTLQALLWSHLSSSLIISLVLVFFLIFVHIFISYVTSMELLFSFHH